MFPASNYLLYLLANLLRAKAGTGLAMAAFRAWKLTVDQGNANGNQSTGYENPPA